MSDFPTGLLVSIVGLSVTFFALFIFIGVIILLKKIFPYKEESVEGEEAAATNEMAAFSKRNDEEITAVIAAVAFASQQQTGKPGSSKNPIWTSR